MSTSHAFLSSVYNSISDDLNLDEIGLLTPDDVAGLVEVAGPLTEKEDITSYVLESLRGDLGSIASLHRVDRHDVVRRIENLVTLAYDERPQTSDTIHSTRKVHFIPHIASSSELELILPRIGWYLSPFADRISEIILYSKIIDDLAVARSEVIDPDAYRRLESLTNKIKIEPTTWGISDDDVVFVWNLDPERISSEELEAARKLRRSGRYYEVDPFRTRQEGSFYLWAGANVFTNSSLVLSMARKRFKRFQDEKISRSKSYVFGTGPSLSDFCRTHDFSDGHCIISNSMVKNDELLERLNPVAIAAADPIFHAGCSSYAAAFRSSLTQAMVKTGAYFFIPLRDFAVYNAILSPDLRQRIIPVPFDRSGGFPTNLNAQYTVQPYPNILTLLLLPIASTVSKEIRVVGCDGRPLNENSYFWTHDKSSQYNDQMDAVKLAHPSFFNIDYNDYYTQHCNDLAGAISTLEKSGKEITSLTPSHIPALHEREALDGLNPKLIIIDADAINHFGHFLSYDSRIAETAKSAGIQDITVLGNKAFDSNVQPSSVTSFMKVFSIHSWTIGNRPNGIASVRDREIFESELRDAVCPILNAEPERLHILYTYCGGFELAEAVDSLLGEYRNLTAHINLFWIYNIDETSEDFRQRWTEPLSRMANNHRMYMTVMSQKQSDDLERATGVRVPVAPHPSTTFRDDEVKGFSTRPHTPSAPIKVLFPGGMRIEKGFALTVDVTSRIADEQDFQCIVRALEVPNTPPKMKSLRDTLLGRAVHLRTEHLDDDEFAGMLADSDIVVCPYLNPDFARRTSGLVVDSLLLGRPMVVIAGTWLGDFVQAHHIGEVAEPNADSMIAAIKRVRDNYSAFSANAVLARSEYLKTDSWSALIKTIAYSDSVRMGVEGDHVQMPLRQLARNELAPWWRRTANLLPPRMRHLLRPIARRLIPGETSL